MLPAGAAGLGVSLFEIHIYVDPLKKALQALWAVGLCGGIGLMLAQVGLADTVRPRPPSYLATCCTTEFMEMYDGLPAAAPLL